MATRVFIGREIAQGLDLDAEPIENLVELCGDGPTFCESTWQAVNRRTASNDHRLLSAGRGLMQNESSVHNV